jgi:hypothetical protein
LELALAIAINDFFWSRQLTDTNARMTILGQRRQRRQHFAIGT